MTEQQQYRVLETRGGVELREYAPCVVADFEVSGSAEQAGNAAFRPLASYIFGANNGSRKLAMTAPVIQQASSERLAMTAPVLQEATDAGTWTVSFVMPGARALAEYPQPDDARVKLRALPAEVAAALRWSGRWSSGNVDRRTAELRAEMDRAGWVPVGAPRWARFDPPWRPAFLRRNEIVIPVAAPGA